MVLRVGDAIANPGDIVEVAVTLESVGDRVAGIQNDLELTPPLHWAGDDPCAVGPDIDTHGTAFGFVSCEIASRSTTIRTAMRWRL